MPEAAEEAEEVGGDVEDVGDMPREAVCLSTEKQVAQDAPFVVL